MYIKNKFFSGIDFREKSIAFATIKMERGTPVIHDIGKQEMKEEIISSSRVTQNGQLTIALSNNLRNGKITKNVHLAIPTQNILVRKITSLPDIEENELAKIINFQIGESIHLPFEDPVYDFVKIGSIKLERIEENDSILVGTDEMEDELTLNELSNQQDQKVEIARSEILLFAASKPLSQDLADVCSAVGLRPLTAEIRALALQRLVSFTHPNWLKEVDMIIDISNSSVDIHIFKEGWVVFSRTMSINRNDYLELTDSNFTEEMLLFEDQTSEFLESHKEIAAAKDKEINDFYLTNIIQEIEKAQNFFRYSLNERDSEFNRIIVTGEKANQVFEALKDRMDSAEIVRIDYRSILADNFKANELLDSCSVAIGLAIRANKVNKRTKSRGIKAFARKEALRGSKH